MLLLILEIGSTSAQERIDPGAIYTGDEPGYVFTGSDVQEIRRGLRERDLLEQRAEYADSLLSLYQQRLTSASAILREQQELIDDYADSKTPGLLEQATDRGTSLVAILMAIGVAFAK